MKALIAMMIRFMVNITAQTRVSWLTQLFQKAVIRMRGHRFSDAIISLGSSVNRFKPPIEGRQIFDQQVPVQKGDITQGYQQRDVITKCIINFGIDQAGSHT